MENIKTFNLTDKELAAAVIFTRSCFTGMGGSRPSDLAKDEYTWVELTDLTDKGYSRHEAAGLISALLAKGFLSGEIVKGRPTDMVVETDGWRWMDTIWDEVTK